MLFLIDIHWKRRTPHPDKPQTGRSTYPISARYPKRAIADAKRIFNRHFGTNLEITDAKERKDLAALIR